MRLPVSLDTNLLVRDVLVADPLTVLTGKRGDTPSLDFLFYSAQSPAGVREIDSADAPISTFKFGGKSTSGSPAVTDYAGNYVISNWQGPTGTLTSDNTNVGNGETVTIGAKTYTFKTALTPSEGEVLIGGSADGSLLNLIRAINHTGTPGTDYSVAVANTQVRAAAIVTGHAITVTASTADTIGTTETSAHLSWGASTLAGGSFVYTKTNGTVFTDGVTDITRASGTITSDNTNVSDGDTVTIGNKTYTFKTALTPTEGQVLIGGSADASLLNLIRAINHTGTPGTDYQCAAANTQVAAAASVTGHAFAVTAIATGTAANAIATAETSAHLNWGGATLTGGVNPNVLGSATAKFAGADVGRSVSGAGIPASTTIVSVESASSCTLSNAATASATGITITISGNTAVGGRSPLYTVKPNLNVIELNDLFVTAGVNQVVQDETERLALTGKPVNYIVRQADTQAYYILTNAMAPSNAASWSTDVAEKDFVELGAELEWELGSQITSTLTFTFRIYNDVNKGTEGIPLSGNPAYPDPGSILTIGTDSANLKRGSINITTGVETVAVAFVTAFSAAPLTASAVVCKAASGDDNAGVATIDSVTASGFNVNLTGPATAGSKLLWMAIL